MRGETRYAASAASHAGAATVDDFCPSHRPPGAANTARLPGERGTEKQPERKPARPASAY